MSEWIEDPVLKLRLHFEPEGDVLVGHIEVEPGGGIGKHFHPNQEERWTVVEGTARFKLGRRKQVATAGEQLVVPPRVRHSLKNVGDATARLRFEAEPALELEPFLKQACAMNRAGSVTKIGLPTSVKAVLEGAVFVERYKETCVLIFPPPFPPPALQGVVFGPIARFAQRRGERQG
jgi:quercetin dioxygenase-like cupin family protein